MAKLLITGSTGYIGSACCEYFAGKYDIVCINTKTLDISDDIAVKTYMDLIQPDIVLHLAALSSPDNTTTYQDYNKVNVLGTYNILQGCKQDTRFINMSSVVVCGTSLDTHDEEWRQNPTSLYALSKANAENIVTQYTNLGRIQGVSLRSCAVVGRCKPTHGVLKDFIDKAKDQSELFPIMGVYPGARKPYLYIQDLCNAIRLVIERSSISGPINIVPDDIISIDEVADIVLKHFNVAKGKIWTQNNFVGDSLCLRYTNKLAELLLGWKPRYTSANAIRKTLGDIDNGY